MDSKEDAEWLESPEWELTDPSGAYGILLCLRAKKIKINKLHGNYTVIKSPRLIFGSLGFCALSWPALNLCYHIKYEQFV